MVAVVVGAVLTVQSLRASALEQSSRSLDQAVAAAEGFRDGLGADTDPTGEQVRDSLEAGKALTGTDDYDRRGEVDEAAENLRDLTARARVALLDGAKASLAAGIEEAEAIIDLAGGHMDDPGPERINDLDELFTQAEQVSGTDDYDQIRELADLTGQIDAQATYLAAIILRFDAAALDEALEAGHGVGTWRDDALNDARKRAKQDRDKAVDNAVATDITDRREATDALNVEVERAIAEEEALAEKAAQDRADWQAEMDELYGYDRDSQ
ncbi:hypothetical protein GCG21_13685 [Pseudactinotalea sp. HY160]|uniref:hypothetical protein n=1 Tax=Pseudactinotalea sp. HY160 TaxID=2654490 RepID=UPI00128BCF1F|nr:hypothetical protein [Pseudactinotalea sp. HY160]MPV51038.1 hypothetical protein [Pseudactinotalea sp. HY160]